MAAASDRLPPLELGAARPALARLAEAAYPDEACGLLLGLGRRVVEVLALPNVEALRPGERFELDPLDLRAAEDLADARGLALVGLWHSHPDRPAIPSREDERAAFEGWSYPIVSVVGGRAGSIRSWILGEDGLREESFA